MTLELLICNSNFITNSVLRFVLRPFSFRPALKDATAEQKKSEKGNQHKQGNEIHLIKLICVSASRSLFRNFSHSFSICDSVFSPPPAKCFLVVPLINLLRSRRARATFAGWKLMAIRRFLQLLAFLCFVSCRAAKPSVPIVCYLIKVKKLITR